MWRLIVGGLGLLVACASAGAPPGGPERHVPPEIISITPDSGAINVKAGSAEFKFDEVVSDRPSGVAAGLDQIFLISPRNGAPNVSWHRTRITVKPRNGFRPNTAYRVTLLPGLADLRGNVRKDTRTIVFATGPTFPPFSINGVVFDWIAQHVVVGAYVEAISHPDTSIVYLAATDTAGQFELGPLPEGTYTVRGLIDANANRVLDRNEKWDSVSVPITRFSPTIELDAIERDSLPAAFVNVSPIDSFSLKVDFDKPLDPSLPLQPALIQLQRTDSSQIEVTRVQWQSAFDHERQARDSARRADSLRARAAAAPAATPTPTPAAPALAIPTPGGPRSAPQPAKPKAPPPEHSIVVTVSPTTPLLPNTTYRITARGIRNLLGNSHDLTRSFTVPKPVPRDTTTKRPPPPGADTARRPPPPPRPPPPLR